MHRIAPDGLPHQVAAKDAQLREVRARLEERSAASLGHEDERKRLEEKLKGMQGELARRDRQASDLKAKVDPLEGLHKSSLHLSAPECT